jgi:hypothetical protein
MSTTTAPSLFDMTVATPPTRNTQPLINKGTARKLHNMFHPTENAARLKMIYYMPLYTALHLPARWCGNPTCPNTPAPSNPKCPLCKTLFCCADHLDRIHATKEGNELVRNSWCDVVTKTQAVREYLCRVFLEFKTIKGATPEQDTLIFAESETIQQLDYWFWHCTMLGVTWRMLSTLSESEFFDAVQYEPMHRFVDAMGWELSQEGFNMRPKIAGYQTTLVPGAENVFQDITGLYLLCCFAQDLLCSGPGKAQALMTAAALVQASRESFALATHPFVGITLTKDAMRPEFFSGPKATPLAIYLADERLKWPALYYVVQLIPLGLDKDLPMKRRFMFSVGLYVTTKDTMILCSAGTEEEGFGFTSLLPESKTSPWIDKKSFVADLHVGPRDTARWFTRVAELTDPESTAAHREQLVRLLTAMSGALEFPKHPFPVYRLVTARVVMHIV